MEIKSVRGEMNKINNQHDDIQASDLLTIKQAARLLNVSEVSLRRWTNSGQLSCLRVGAHRARRFRRSDLMAFMEKQSVREAIVNTGVEPVNNDLPRTHIMLEGITINYGSHLCSFYENIEGQLKLSVPLLADGLRQGDICFLVATPETQEIILQHLAEVGLNVKSILNSDQLIVTDGMDSGSEMLDFLRNQFAQVTRAGNRSLRLVGDMSWVLAKNWSMTELNSYELSYNNSLGHQYPVVSLCQYDARDFSGTSVLCALRCHEDTFRYPLGRFLGSTSNLAISAT